ncbi:type VI secretion system ATPase TssH [Marinimicrobium alkaliphilum]|uniref:type VI secretion system ATPase TssH n=1 Tax=Marinimicrobium alkaliphilum TaxID=2202654 RepID=UPI000DBA5380|nr:type VI secretion system ATPase TssH [Marinimicrobium alkaliphilum]
MITLDLKSLVNKLNNTTRNALEGAAGLCLSRSHYNVEIEHWLIKLLEVDDTDLQAILNKFELSPDNLIKALQCELDRLKNGSSRPPALAPGVVELAKHAWVLASVEYGHQQVTSAHLLAALLLDDTLRRGALESCRALEKLPPESVRELARAVVGSTAESHASLTGDADNTAPSAANVKASATPCLDKYTVNLTQAARDGNIDPVWGRDQEVRQIVDILIRRRQNNPILTGEAGVGKTAVVEGFALRIAAGDVPEPLKNVALRTLDLGLLQAGASVKGEFENRLKSVIAEVKASPQPIILFIDEAHTMIGAGGKEGQGDAANLLKPALARGELRTIAATTWAEYKKYFERDPALTRRFQVVKVEEPGEEKAIDMMRAIAGMLQTHHGVRIMDEAVVESVRLSSRYMPGRQLPDKSVSLLDTACARVALSQSATPAPIEDTRRDIDQISANLKSLTRENATLGNCQARIDELSARREMLAEQLERQHAQWQNERELVDAINTLQHKIEEDHHNDINGLKEFEPSDQDADREELQALLQQLEACQGDDPMIKVHVDGQAIAEVISNWTGIPLGKMLADEIQSVLSLGDTLSERVIGQNHSLEAIAQSIRTARAGLTDPRKPIGVFFMVGPSGVGKTETALALADTLYGGEHNLTVINMSEFKEEHKVSMLLGSPPGYVGYGEGGVLTEAVRRKPYSVILLDEMEKAHPGVQDVFYNLFDKGTIKDGEGRDIDFRNTVIIMTSNAGEEHIRAMCHAQEDTIAPDVLLDNFRPQLLKHFKPAFLGRTTIVPYYPLGDSDLMKICDINMRKITRRLQENYGAEFTYDDDVKLHIVARSQEVDTGARNIENILTRTLLPQLASECLARMSERDSLKRVHVGINAEGEFHYELSA